MTEKSGIIEMGGVPHGSLIRGIVCIQMLICDKGRGVSSRCHGDEEPAFECCHHANGLHPGDVIRHDFGIAPIQLRSRLNWVGYVLRACEESNACAWKSKEGEVDLEDLGDP